MDKRRFRVFLCCLAVLLLSFAAGCGKEQAKEDTAVYVKTQTVQYGAVSGQESYSGTVKGRYESDLAFQVGGKIVERNVDAGDRVSAGDVLMVIDARDVQESVNAANAQVASARSQLTLAQSDLERFKQLYAANAVSAQQLDQYQANYENALAAYNQAQAQAGQSENSLGYTRLTAGSAGVISSVSAEAGQVVAAGQAVASIVKDGKREIEIAVPENKIKSVSTGQSAVVTFWALDNVQVQGVVREIAPVADSAARTYKVRIALADPPQDMQLGMTASVSFAAGSTSAVTLPLSALYQTENKSQVWLVNGDSKLELKDVQVVSLGKNEVQVQGLNQGDTVVTAGVHKLYEGEAVKPADGDAL